MKRGFTLIELLVVISIISLISSVVLASVQSAREKAKQTSFRQYLGEIVSAAELYRIDKGNFGAFTSGYINNADTNAIRSMEQNLGKYLEIMSTSETPDFVYGGYIYLYTSPSTLSSYSCGEANTGADFFVMFYSTRNDLSFRPLINHSTGAQHIANTSPRRYYYCADSIYK